VIGSIAAHGTVTEGGLAGTFDRVVDPATGRFAEHLIYELFTTGSGHDGRSEWVQDVSGGAHFLNAKFARQLAATDLWVAQRGWCDPTYRKAHMKRLAPSRADQGRYDRWQARPVGGAPVELTFERSSGFLHSVAEQLSQSRSIITYSRWRRLPNGYWIPLGELRSYPEDESSTEVDIHQAGLATAMKASFAPPALPHDYGISNAAGMTTITYEDDGRTRVYIPVTVNGKGPFTFELDSGGHLILTAETAEQLGLNPQGNIASGGTNSVRRAGYVRLSDVGIGGAYLHDQPAKVLTLPNASSDRGNRPPRAGVIGLELFERFVVGIDRLSKTVTLQLPRTLRSPRGVSLSLKFAEDAPLVTGKFGGRSGDFMLDTGNAGPTIIEHAWATKNSLLPRLRGLKINDATYRCDRIQVGPYNLSREIISYFGPVVQGSESMRAAAGILGEPLLSRFNTLYDYSRAMVWLQELPNSRARPFNRSGLVVTKDVGEFLKVSEVLAASPGAEVGVNKGDTILAIDGKSTDKMGRAEASERFAGDLGQKVTLLIRSEKATSTKVLYLRNVLPCRQ
jgi:hypothetical protein